METPDNLEVFASHGTADCPKELKELIRPEFDGRLIRNFSDFGTAELIAGIPENQRLIPRYGRIAGDPNRSPDASDLFRENDFGGVPIFHTMPDERLREKMLSDSYIPYHREALRRIMALHGNPNDQLLVVDIHDTGNLLLGKNPKQDEMRLAKTGWHMPPVILSNQDGRTASLEVMEDFISAFETRFGFHRGDIRINDPYKGGYFTQRYGLPDSPLKNDLDKAGNPERQVVQIELGRYLYMDEKTQKLDPKAVSHFRNRLSLVLNEVADGLIS